MSLAGFALRYRAIVVTFVIVLMLWGILSYRTMPRREDPEYTVRTCQVLTEWPGTPTEKVEELVTAPLEEGTRIVALAAASNVPPVFVQVVAS